MAALPLLLLALIPQSTTVPAAEPQEESLWDRLHFYANGRLRAESTLDQPSGEDRHRGRMRLRVGARYELSEDLQAEARLTTTSGDSNNPHWDFGAGADGFNGSDLALDRFYLNWSACDDLDLRAGQFPHVFVGPPVFGEFLWDADVHPSGVAGIWGPGARADRSGYDLRAAGYVVVENSSDDDPAMLGLQGNLYLAPGESVDVHLSSSLSHWSSLGGGGGVPGNQGNTDVMGDFLILEGFAAATVESGFLGQTTGFVQAMHNLEDEDGEENGLAAGVRLGRSGRKGDVNLFATYYDLDANALFSPPAQDDTPLPGTGLGAGMDGVIAGGQYWAMDNLSLKAWVLTSSASGEDPVRLRFDVDFSVR